jgi:type IV conjugative transfer system protein TraE
MNIETSQINNSRVVRQRNLFLTLTILLSISLSALSIKMLTSEERIIMIPSLTSEITISKSKVSSSYLEQMSMVFLNALLDLSESDVLHKRDLILKYTSNSDKGFAKKINEYFAEASTKYKTFDLVTYFTVKNMEIDEQSGEVIAHGTLTSRYGRHGYESRALSYRLSFEFSGGFLRLKEFDKVIDEKDKKEEVEKS